MKEATEKIKAYKALSKDWTCQGFKFAVGETYTHDGSIEICKSGFHACPMPMDIFRYYPTDSIFCEVELSGELQADGDKTCASVIEIVKQITLDDLIKTEFNLISKKIKVESGNYAHLASSGDSARLESSGKHSVAVGVGLGGRVKGVLGTVVGLIFYEGNKPVRLVPGIIGECGLEPDTWYELDDRGRFVEVKA